MSSRTTPRCATCGKTAKMVPEGMEKPKDYFRVRIDGTGVQACDEHFKKGPVQGLTPAQVKEQAKNLEEENMRFKAFQARLEACERFINLAADTDGKIMAFENVLNHKINPAIEALQKEVKALQAKKGNQG